MIQLIMSRKYRLAEFSTALEVRTLLHTSTNIPLSGRASFHTLDSFSEPLRMALEKMSGFMKAARWGSLQWPSGRGAMLSFSLVQVDRTQDRGSSLQAAGVMLGPLG